jgi:predicted ATPase
MQGRPEEQAPVSFAMNLRRLRVQAGLSQELLAERARMSVRGLRYLEHGVRHPYPATVERLADALALAPASRAAFVACGGSGGASPETGAGGSALPAPTGPLVGREHQLDEILDRLQRPDLHMLSITGPGGVGKSRLALEVAARIGPMLGAAAIWVPLELLTDATLVPSAVARAVGVTAEDPRRLVEVMARALDQRFLILDNMEQVADAARFLSDLLSRCPALTVITTSRVSLGIRAEQLFPLEPLEHPHAGTRSGVQALAVSPAVDLFLRRVQAVDPHFKLTEHNAAAVATICQRLEGFPLALELAAARAAVLPPEAMSVRLDRRLDVLAGAGPDLPDRQRTMRATVAWSYDLLSTSAQALFRSLSGFACGACLQTVEALPLGRREQPLGSALDDLEALVRGSLLRVTDQGDATGPRYRMHELIREYGLEQLTCAGEVERLSRWQAHHFLALAEAAERHYYGPESAGWLDRLDVEHANLRAALLWSERSGRTDLALRLGSALSWFWYVRGHATEGRARLAASLAAPDAADLVVERIPALLGAAQLAQTQGDYVGARELLEECVAASRQTGDQRRIAAALLTAGFVARVQEDYASATEMLQQADTIAGSAGPAFIAAAARHHLGMIAADRDADLAAARTQLEDSLHRYRELGMARFEALVLLSLSAVACRTGDLDRAADLGCRSLRLMRETGDVLSLHGALDALAEVAVARRELVRAVRLAAAAEHFREVGGIRAWPVEARRTAQWLATARAALAPREYQEHWQDASSLTVEVAVEEALRANDRWLDDPAR